MGDLISRQAAIDAVHKNYDGILDFRSDGKTVAQSFEDILTALSPTQPEQSSYEQGRIAGRAEMWMEFLRVLKNLVGSEVWNDV